MKTSLLFSSLAFLLFFGILFRDGIYGQGTVKTSLDQDLSELKMYSKKINIQVGSTTFKATLEENATASALISLFPLTLDMNDLNRNEKFAKLPQNLPTQTFSPGTIHSGDLLLWGNNTLVIFYETFSSSYSYSRLGKIDNPSGLKEALGRGDVKITFLISE